MRLKPSAETMASEREIWREHKEKREMRKANLMKRSGGEGKLKVETKRTRKNRNEEVRY